MKRVLILYTERSGSNLVRRILGQSDELVAPPPAHFFTAFGPWWNFLGTDEKTRERICDLATALLSVHFSPWKHEVPSQGLHDHLEEVGWKLPHVVDYCYSEYARAEGAEGYVVKGNGIVDHAFHIASVFPDAQFIYLARDPRDVALSFFKVPTGPKAAYAAGALWAREQRACIEFREALPERVHLVRYEDLVREPRKTAENLFAFLELEFSDRFLDPGGEIAQQAKSTSFWANLDKPILHENTEKYLAEVRAGQIRAIEQSCAPMMRYHGYELRGRGCPGRRGPLHHLTLMTADGLLRRLRRRSKEGSEQERTARRKRAAIFREIRLLAERRPLRDSC